jgi:hypothetical protein
MAIKHLSVKKGKVGYGEKHALYIRGLGKYADRDDVLHVEDANLPPWAKDGTEFFAAADKYERANGRAYLEVEFAIPREASDPVGFAQRFASQLFGACFVYTLVIHNKLASDGKMNIHAHLMFSDRKLDGIERNNNLFFRRANSKHPQQGGTKKDRVWNAREQIQKVRESYAQYVREECGLKSFDMNSSETPEPKIGPALKGASLNYHQKRKQRLSDVMEIREARREISILSKEIHQITTTVRVSDVSHLIKRPTLPDTEIKPEPPDLYPSLRPR